MTARSLPVSIGLMLGFGTIGLAQSPGVLDGVRRIVFLGDSITYSGQYIVDVETYLRLKNPDLTCEFLNLGLPSETVSGLSEPGHAGGSFPRPELRERLDRVLEEIKPDLIVACYGMNDGLYYPFSEERFVKFQEGMTQLRSKAATSGAKVVHLTPPVFDAFPIKSRTLPEGRDEYRQPFEGYDRVLDRYSGWLLAKRASGWDIVDIHGPLTIELARRRQLDPAFRLAGDGVHLDTEGHWIIARELLVHWGVATTDLSERCTRETALKPFPAATEILDLVDRKQRVLKDSWLNKTGHKRPGMTPGFPLDQAKIRVSEIEAEIRKKLAAGR